MRNSYRSLQCLLLVTFFFLVLTGCTKKFEDFNRDTNGITDDQLNADFNSIGAFFPAIQYAVHPHDVLPSDVGEFLSGGSWAGYLMVSLPGTFNPNYHLFAGWESWGLFGVGYNQLLSPINEVKRRDAETLAPDFWAVALILKVAGMHKVTDIYGPVPYSRFGEGGVSVAYDSQEDIYNAFFTELDQATDILRNYIADNPGAKPFAKFDRIYGGDYTKWLKYANSLRLRLAMHLVDVDPDKARLQAEKAVDETNGGVFTTAADNALVAEGLNPLYVTSHIWGDTRTGAAIVTFMKGYSDPRMPKYFEPSSIIPGEYVGIRVGSIFQSQAEYLQFSNVSKTAFAEKSPVMLMNAAEVYFWKAEGALRGWNMGAGTAQQFYEDGIRVSFEQWGVTGADEYLDDNVSVPANHVDPVNPVNNISALTTIKIKWDESASNEEKLERIITQQWIANFPNGTEAWTTFRRTGYPKLFPVAVNNSGGTIDTDIQIRRMNYPGSEYVSNAAEVAKGVEMLGGPDNGGTRLWWDVPGDNF